MRTITTSEDNFSNELLNHIKEKNNKEIPRYIYHYTSIESLFAGILVNDNNETKVCLRATNALYLNDPTEVKRSLSFLEKIFGTKIINDYNDYLEYSSNYFVTSFSCNKDELPMWDMYTKDSSGIVLCFDTNMIPQKTSLFNCIYEDDKLIDLIDEFIQNNENNAKEHNNDLCNKKSLWWFAFIFSLIIIVYAHNEEFGKEFNKDINENLLSILKYAISLKNPSYNYEKEVRLITIFMDSDEAKEKVKFYYKNNYIIPYIEHYFPKEALREIIVGPNNDFDRIRFSIKTYLKHIGFEHVKITHSNISYRKS